MATNSNTEDMEASALQRSSFMEYLATASSLVETNPELLESIGIGKIPEAPIIRVESPLCVIDNYQGKNTETSDNDSSPPSVGSDSDDEKSSWMFDLIQTLSGWLYSSVAAVDYSHTNLTKSNLRLSADLTTSIPELDEEHFWSEWEWVLSRTEEIAIQQSSKQAKQIDEELQNLRRTATQLKQRPYFVSKAQCILSRDNSPETSSELCGIFTEQQLQELDCLPLDASLRSKLLRDVVDQFSDEWLEFIGRTFFQPDKPQEASNYPIFIENYAEKPYAKNITGALVSMGFVASHGSEQSLTSQVLGDIMWSWWSTLIRSIREINGEVSATSSEKLANQIILAGPVIARVWYETLSNTKNISSPGTLPEQWRIKEQEEANRLKQLRAVGMIDAKFRDGPSQEGCLHSTISPERLSMVKQKLEERYYQH
eukprot:CAMPEP_0206195052 /NCGR_PEP_ID=MMETSP0166-20121206/7587_1 /ASSEMBLY_ACC=CAM_ASM_000260 /TAXON_ID=95228 /ORGANISM="Vannella robusta, Strain DIVA3 518/3/11/1/6" /LENGTH=426 /DNA_ID=CAMNT_0053612191 /DNA_START=46 /DNA_END=1326 /DNA_ORIENTATION=-